MTKKNEDKDLTPAENDQITEADRQSALESRRRFVRSTLVAGGLVAASLKAGIRPAFAQTSTTTQLPTSTTTLLPTSTTTLLPTSTTTLLPTSTTTLLPTSTTTLLPTTTINPTTTAAPQPSTLAPAPAMTVGGLAALATALGLIVRKQLRRAPAHDPSKPDNDSSDID